MGSNFQFQEYKVFLYLKVNENYLKDFNSGLCVNYSNMFIKVLYERNFC